MAGEALIPQSTTASRPTTVMTCPPIPTYSPAVTRRVVESAFDSWRLKFSQPPKGGRLPWTPWLCMYWPLSSVARDGQQSG